MSSATACAVSSVDSVLPLPVVASSSCDLILRKPFVPQRRVSRAVFDGLILLCHCIAKWRIYVVLGDGLVDKLVGLG